MVTMEKSYPNKTKEVLAKSNAKYFGITILHQFL